MALLLIGSLLGSVPLSRAEAPRSPIRIGVLAFGTVNWELTAIEQEAGGAAGSLFVPTRLASTEAAKIALLSGGVDLIIADWIWVAAQRQQGRDLSFIPYSTTHGALLVPAGSSIRSVADLPGKRLGIAGGALDKNWLLLQALAKQQSGLDLDHAVEKTFGAPPLLNEQIKRGALDGVLTYWQFAAKLQAAGYRQLLDGQGMLRGLGIDAALPSIGYVFSEAWAGRNGQRLQSFIDAADHARGRLCDSEESWRRVAPVIEEKDPTVLGLLRSGYCQGRVRSWGPREIDAAARVQRLLPSGPGEKPGDPAKRELPAGTFWKAAAP
ncbi:MAG: ABC transporter substrate-binding protein [Methylotetracoccus sp.]